MDGNNKKSALLRGRDEAKHVSEADSIYADFDFLHSHQHQPTTTTTTTTTGERFPLTSGAAAASPFGSVCLFRAVAHLAFPPFNIMDG